MEAIAASSIDHWRSQLLDLSDDEKPCCRRLSTILAMLDPELGVFMHRLELGDGNASPTTGAEDSLTAGHAAGRHALHEELTMSTTRAGSVAGHDNVCRVRPAAARPNYRVFRSSKRWPFTPTCDLEKLRATLLRSQELVHLEKAATLIGRIEQELHARDRDLHNEHWPGPEAS